MLGIRGQFFANAGNLTTWGRLLDEKKWMKNFADDTRVAVGMGLVWGTRIGRLEANYSWILKSHAHVRCLFACLLGLQLLTSLRAFACVLSRTTSSARSSASA